MQNIDWMLVAVFRQPKTRLILPKVFSKEFISFTNMDLYIKEWFLSSSTFPLKNIGSNHLGVPLSRVWASDYAGQWHGYLFSHDKYCILIGQLKSHFKGLSPSNILYDPDTKEVIIQDWFRFSLTGHGQMGFFQRNFKYCAPEEIIKHVKSFNRHQARNGFKQFLQ